MGCAAGNAKGYEARRCFAAREGDYESECVWPEIPELGKFHGLMAGLMKAGGGTPTAGRQLHAWALKAGAERSQVTVSYSTTSYHTPEWEEDML